MMFIVRSAGARPEAPDVAIKLTRKTPAVIPDSAGKTDYFCLGEAEATAALRDAGWAVVELRDGWYQDDAGGGVAIFGHGKYWELRDTPFTVREAAGPPAEAGSEAGEIVNVRRAIFGA
jgi:hypothetical protein